jgi:hypothetical protein
MWLYRWLPIQDLPQHLASLRVVHEVHTGGPASETYAVDLRQTQYLLFYVVGDLLAYFFDIRTAALLLFTAYMLGTVAAMHTLLRSLGRDPRLALLTVPLLTNSQFLLGLIQFLLGVPLMLWGWSLAIDYSRAWRRNDAVLLAVIAALTFYAHVVPFGVLVMGLAILAPWRSPRALARYALPLSPAGLLVAQWLLFTRAGDFVRNAVTSGAENKDFWPFAQSFHEMYSIAFNTYPDSADEMLFAYALLAGAILTVLACAPRRRTFVSTARWLLVPLACAVFYFRSEGTNGFLGHIRDRFALIAVFALIPAMRAPRGLCGALGTCAMVVIALMTAETWSWHLSRFQVECGDLDGALAHIPPSKHVAGLIFSSESHFFEENPFLHYGAYYFVDKGGSANFSFAGYPHWVYSYKPHRDPLGASPPVFLWEWRPDRIEPREELAASYDYVLTRGLGFDPPHGWFTKTWEGDHWSVWERTPK